MRILYVGQLDRGGTCLQRRNVLRELGHELVCVDTQLQRAPLHRRATARMMSRLGSNLDWSKANRQLLSIASDGEFDLMWVDKSQFLRTSTLLAFRRLQPSSKLLAYSLDDMLNPSNSSFRYRRSLPLYDLHVTNKSYNARELLELGARRTLFIVNAYDSNTHRPIELTPEERRIWQTEVCFIGAYERDRCHQMMALAEAGIPVVVYCAKWKSRLGQHHNLKVLRRSVLGDDYARAICAAKINLGFLRKINRDLQTTRSVEIPACGGFMLAERTDEHLAMFEEGVEAAFFDSTAELIEKCKYYLEHEDERQRIANNGRARCLNGGYSYHEQLKKVLMAIESS